jgi:protein-S-isoprenylcysteine O-methyltransferase Ste14
MTGLQITAFAVLSVPALVLSFPYLREPRSHGFARFLGFEGTLLLIIANADVWFEAAASPAHLLSWILLAASLALALHAYSLLRRRGRPTRSIETTTALVTSGAYHYIRHPLYASLLLLAGGAFLKDPRLWTTIVFCGTVAAFYATALAEEREALTRFGEPYRQYMQQTKRFIPYLF